MDKFGIFNLLNSFFNFYAASKTNDAQKTEREPNDQNNLFFEKSTPSLHPLEKPSNAINRANSAPLQSEMLKTMYSHEKFITKAKQNAKKPPFTPKK